MRHRYIVMMRTAYGWQQCGPTFLTEQSARDARNEYKRGPDVDKTFRIFVELDD